MENYYELVFNCNSDHIPAWGDVDVSSNSHSPVQGMLNGKENGKRIVMLMDTHATLHDRKVLEKIFLTFFYCSILFSFSNGNEKLMGEREKCQNRHNMMA